MPCAHFRWRLALLVCRRHATARLVGCAILAWTAAGSRVVTQEVSAEYRLKAAVLSKFPQFVEWPALAWDAQPTLQLCVVRPNPFGAALADVVAGERVRGKPMAVRELAPGAAVDGCHVLFVSSPPPRAAAERPILTVSDRPGFLDDGGVVQLRLDRGRVRFDIANDAAARAGLRLSAQLLRLAGEVRGGRP